MVITIRGTRQVNGRILEDNKRQLLKQGSIAARGNHYGTYFTTKQPFLFTARVAKVLAAGLRHAICFISLASFRLGLSTCLLELLLTYISMKINSSILLDLGHLSFPLQNSIARGKIRNSESFIREVYTILVFGIFMDNIVNKATSTM